MKNNFSVSFQKVPNKVFKEKKDGQNVPYITLPELNYCDFRTYFDTAPTFSKLIFNEYSKIVGTNIIGKSESDETIIKKYSIREKVDKLIFSCVLNGGAFVQVGWTDYHDELTNFKIEQPFNVMVGKPDENNQPVFFYYSNEWYVLRKNYSTNEYGEKSEGNAEWRLNSNAKYVPIQNYSTEFGTSPRQIIQFKMYDFFDTYNFTPKYISGKNSVFFDSENGRYVANLIANKFNDNTIFNVPDKGYESQEAKDDFVDFINEVRGPDSAGGAIVNFYDHTTGNKMEAVPIDNSSSNEQYINLDDKNQESLLRLFQLPNPALAGFRSVGQLGNSSGEDLKVSEMIYNRNIIIPSRNKIEDFLKEYIFKYLPQFEYTWDNVSMVDEVVNDVKENINIPTGSGTTEVVENVQATALNGAQISSLIEIVTAWKTGTLSIESAKQIVKSAFPTFSDLDVQKIFL